jgi:hypothetical protein
VGLRTEATTRDEFLAAFEKALLERDLDAERLSADVWSADRPLANAFRFVDGSAPTGAWSVKVTLGLPASGWGKTEYQVDSNPWGSSARPVRSGGAFGSGKRASLGMVVSVELQSPADAASGVAPSLQRTSVVFPAPEPPADAASVKAGVKFPWKDAGRTAGRLVLEALHRAARDLDSNRRVALDPATRIEAER